MEYFDLHQKMKGEPVNDPGFPPPLKYNFLSYIDSITNAPITNGSDDGSSTWALRQISMDDMARAAHDDVVDAYTKNGNKTGLGDQLDDEGLAKYTGIPYQK